MELLVEGLFALVFAWALGGYLMRRDPLQRDVAVMFSSLAVLFLLDVVNARRGEVPTWLATAGSVLTLAQPVLTLRLVRRLRPVPTWLYAATVVGWLVASGIVLTVSEPYPPSSLVIILGYFLPTGAVAGWLLWWLARQRVGSSRARLALAATATWLFAVGIFAAGLGRGEERGEPDDNYEAGPWLHFALALCLLSAITYVLAFVPPRWLRRFWSARTLYGLTREFVQGPADEPPETLRRRYVDVVRRVTGADAVAAWAPAADAGKMLVASVGLPPDATAYGSPPWTAALESLPARAAKPLIDVPAERCPPWLAACARAADARFGTAVSGPVPGGWAVLALLNRHRSLFTWDDLLLLADLGAQAAALIERQTLLAERGLLTDRLAASVEAMSAASQAKSDFLANMSHELRTPLNAIIGFSDLMSAEERFGERIAVPADWIEHVNSSGRHLLELINDVLDLSKVEAGRIELHREVLDLRTAVDAAVSSLRSLSDDKRQEVTVAVASLRVYADPLRFRQILTNLLSNAIKFTPEDGRIFVTARRVEHEIAIGVADTGPGIDAKDQDRVFDQFQQLGKQPGTGLGLTLTRRLVQAHGGGIVLESQPGRGAKFTVTLPAADSLAEADPRRPTPVGGHAGVLIVEDDPATANLFAAYLRPEGYHVTVVGSGEEALAAAAAGSFELVLLDVRLPGMDGWEVLRQLKADPRLRDTPVVIVSVVDERPVGLALGAADYFVKPVDRQALLAWLARSGLIPPLSEDAVTVLAIDNDPKSLGLIEMSLSQQGITVLTAEDGLAGLRLAQEVPVDLVICDLLMPGLDGYDLIAALHEDPRTRDIPVVVLTAQELTADDKARLAAKPGAIMAKMPEAARPDQMIATISRITGAAATTPVG